MIKCSVIIPTFRRSEVLIHALESVLRQDYPSSDYEIIIVDNAPVPTPELEDLCKRSSPCPVRYVHESRTGLHYARHAGAKTARGDILVYIDDDVVCPSGWLKAITAPFDEPRTALVGGRAVLRLPCAMPDWMEPFRMYLSERDEPDGSGIRNPNWAPVGCNMAVRRDALFAVGGFNPDGFGDAKLLRYRGDGENGLAIKIHQAGLRAFYSREAVLEHVVPASRLTPEYIRRRLMLGGIELAYSRYRYGKTGPLRYPVHVALSGLRMVCAAVRTIAQKYRGEGLSSVHAALILRQTYFRQALRLLFSRKLRRFTVQKNYWESL